MDLTPPPDVPLRPGEVLHERSEWAVAVDLGQSMDPTAICVLQHRTADVIVERGTARLLGTGRRVGETFDVRHLQRLPLGLSYVEQVAEVRRLLARPPLPASCPLVIDETGVGRPVGDIFDTAGLEPIRVAITGGDSQSATGGRWHVAKGLLIAAVDARLHTGELRFAANLTDAGALAEELRDLRRKVSAAGRFSYEARVGKHDDLVLAVALALWNFTTKPAPPEAAFGVYGMGAA